jgi:hypothetical protein
VVVIINPLLKWIYLLVWQISDGEIHRNIFCPCALKAGMRETRTEMTSAHKPDKKPIETYEHKDKQRLNNPPVGLGTVESGGTENIAMWMLDTDYDGRSLYPRQVFFPLSGAKDGWSRLAKNLKAEVDEELMEAYRGTLSLPFQPGPHERVAVKIIDDRGIESLRIMEVK